MSSSSGADNKHHVGDEDDDDGPVGKYQPPKEVPLDEILNKDTDDPALNKYKQTLIGDAANVILEPNDKRKVLMKRAVLTPDDQPEIVFDLTSNVENYKDRIVRLKEDTTFRLKLEFYVQRDIVSGLKYVQVAHRGPIKTDKTTYMLGSRAPKPELQEFISEKETAPSGMLARGKYAMKATITDDDKNVYLKWEWILEIDKK